MFRRHKNSAAEPALPPVDAVFSTLYLGNTIYLSEVVAPTLRLANIELVLENRRASSGLQPHSVHFTLYNSNNYLRSAALGEIASVLSHFPSVPD